MGGIEDWDERRSEDWDEKGSEDWDEKGSEDWDEEGSEDWDEGRSKDWDEEEVGLIVGVDCGGVVVCMLVDVVSLNVWWK